MTDSRSSDQPIESGAASSVVVPVLAFHEVYERGFGYVCNALRRLGVHGQDMEDLCQDVFVVVYRRLSDFDTMRPLKPWLFGIAYRVARDFQRRPRHRRESLDEPELHLRSADGNDEALAHERRGLVLKALEQVKMERRAVLIMHDIDGYAMPEIADTLSLPLNTAYSRLRLARDEFARAVKALEGGAHA